MDAIDGILPRIIYFYSDIKTRKSYARTNYTMSYASFNISFERWYRGFVFEPSTID